MNTSPGAVRRSGGGPGGAAPDGGGGGGLMLVARVIAKVEPGGAPLGALRLVRALRAHGVGSRLFVGEATRRGLRLLDDAGVDFEVRGRGDDELQYACDERFATWLRPRLAGADLVHAHMFGAAIAAVRAEEGGIDLDGAQRYAARFSPERVASQYARIYRRLLAGLVAEVAIAA